MVEGGIFGARGAMDVGLMLQALRGSNKHSLKVELKGDRLRFGWVARFCEGSREVEVGNGGLCSPRGSKGVGLTPTRWR